MLFRENIRRFFAPHNHTGPIYLYAQVIFLLLAPWSLFLPAALLGSPRSLSPGVPGERGDQFMATSSPAFTSGRSSRSSRCRRRDGITTFSPYFLPQLCSSARMLLASPADLSPWALRLRMAGQGLFALATGSRRRPAFVPKRRAAGALGCASALAGPRVIRGRLGRCLGFAVVGYARSRFLPAMLATSIAGLSFLFLIAIPELASLRSRQLFAAQVRERTNLKDLALFHAREIVFDLAAPSLLPEYRDPDRLADDLRSGAVGWVIARRRYLRDVALPAEWALEEPSHPWERNDQIGDKLILLAAYRK